MADLERLARECEILQPELWNLGIFAGYSYADTPDTGVCLTAVHEAGFGQIAEKALDRLEALAVSLDGRVRVSFASEGEILEGIRRAECGEAPPSVILVESSDNIGGGAPGDCTGALRFLLRHGMKNALLAINDPHAVSLCRPGEKIRLSLGGKGSQMDEGPVDIEGLCRSVHDGVFDLEDKRSHLASMLGARMDMGPCAIIELEGITILITSRKTPPMDLGQFRSVGIEPSEFRVIVVKAAVAYRDAYAVIPHKAFHLDTPGPCASHLGHFPYRKLNQQKQL
jgi:microcystin degradation protein MlrC